MLKGSWKTKRVKPRLKYKTVVLGSNASAMCYALVHCFPLILVEPAIPFLFEFYDKLQLPFEEESFKRKTLSSEIKVGNLKRKIFHALSYTLGLKGLMPFSNRSKKILLDEENRIISISSEGDRSYDVSFEKLIIVDTINCSEFSVEGQITVEQPDQAIIKDLFIVRDEKLNGIDFIQSAGHIFDKVFVSQEGFQFSSHNKFELTTFVKANKANIHDFELSEINLKYGLVEFLNQNGISQTVDDIEHVVREIEHLPAQIQYPNTDIIEHIIIPDEEEFLCQNQKLLLDAFQLTGLIDD